jgi:predicted SAM-dependent methyltransferase
MTENSMSNPYSKLHLGCGSVHIPGFYHVDIMAFNHVDRLADVRKLDFIPDDAAQLIYCSHVLEHFGRWEIPTILAEWCRVTAPGGTLRLAVPDFSACAEIFYEDGLADGLSGLIGLISGGQKDDFDFHKMIFDEPSLSNLLIDAGFSEISRWDWRTTEHTAIDDYSQAYLPHMDKQNGRLMSLNLEAIK